MRHSKYFPDEKQRGGGTISAPDPSGLPVSNTKISSIRPISSKKSRSAAGKEITLKDPSNRKGKTFDWIDVSILVRMKRSPGREHSSSSCLALQDTGSPASSIRKKVWNDMPGSGAASWATFVPDRVSRTTYHWDGISVTIFLYGSKRRNEDETAVAVTAQDEGSAAGDHRFKNGLITLSE